MSVTELDDEETVREMHDVHVPRVDAVDGPAHGRPFLILKAADQVDPLIELDRVLKAKYDPAQVRQMGKDGRALRGPDGVVTLPIGDRDDLDAAVPVVKAGDSGPDLRQFLARRARQLKATDVIPDNWAADGSITPEASVSKAMDLHEAVEALDAGVIEAGDVVTDAAGVVAPTHEGDPDDPASPAWEAVDAARARAAVEKLVWLKQLVADMESREDAEVAITGDAADARAGMELDQVVCALDAALAVLAKFAVDEQAEADQRAQEITEQAEALGIIKAADVADAVMAVAERVEKAGRVLSSANESALRTAHAALTEVLGRLPVAPEPEEDAAVTAPAPVEKAAADGTAVAAPTEPAPVDPMPVEPAPVAPVEPVEKAGMTPDDLRKLAAKFLQAVPDDKVAEAFRALSGLAAATADDDGEEPAEAPEAEPVEEAAVDPADATMPGQPQPIMEPPAPEPDEVPVEEPVEKSTASRDEILNAVTRAVAGLEERVVKALAAVASGVETVEKRLTVVEAQPAPGGPLLNGVAPTTQSDAPQGLEGVHKAIREIADPSRRQAAAGAAVHEVLTGLLRGRIPTARA